LKLIKSGSDSKSVLARFDAERQALALMDHPNIARIYDGGTSPTGQPFFAMELLRDSLPITLSIATIAASPCLPGCPTRRDLRGWR
jgi:serine/threonine protein kinase